MAGERPSEPSAGDPDEREADDSALTADEGPHHEEDEHRAAEETEPPAAEEMAGPS